MQIWHLTFGAGGRHPLFADETSRLAAVRALARVAGTRIVLFCLVGEHIHVVVAGDRGETGRLARGILLAVRQWTAVGLEPARLRPVEDRTHLRWLVPYMLQQPRRHGLTEQPALWSGSCFVDLIGARQVRGLRLRLGEVLPRLRLRQAHQAVGLPPVKLAPLSDEAIRRAGAYRLARAGAAALCVAHPPEGKSAPATEARAAICHIGRRAAIPSSQMVDVLCITAQAVSRLARKPLPENTVRSVALRLALDDAARGLLEHS